MVEVTAVAPAKINLALRVGRRRADGYHPLKTLFHAIDLTDRVTVRAATRNGVSVSGVDASEVPADSSNLASQAAELMRRFTGRRDAVRIRIKKAIPMAGGLAGGSADAAAALVGINQLWSLGLSHRKLTELGAVLGSDVPFALHGANAIGHGRGEALTAMPSTGQLHWAIVTSREGISTPEVFARFDAMIERSPLEAPPPIPTGLIDAVRRGDVATVGHHLINDLQGAILALRPELADVMAAAKSVGALGAIISGSGPSVACLAESAAGAAQLAADLTEIYPDNPVLVATGPASGAMVTA
jgi:4-diphosphocytidyl-2-C-methyl-D-erythritol kinase